MQFKEQKFPGFLGLVILFLGFFLVDLARGVGVVWGDSSRSLSSVSVKDGAPSSISAAEILRRADGIRNPAESFAMRVEILNPAEATDRSLFEVSVHGNSKTFVKTLEPLRDRGRNLLMLGEEMWVFIPNLKRSVRIALSQKLTGQAANGDISRMRWSGDYEPSIEKEEDGAFILFLAAKKKGLTYDKIRAWVDSVTFRPRQAEFLTPSHKVLKRASFSAYRELAGKIRPSEIRIQDAVRADDVSLIRILSMEVKDFPESLFNQNSLR